jgi:hypothetical protein
MKGGQIQDWRRLDEVWALVGDKPAFAKFIREQVEQMLSGVKPTAAATLKPSLPRPEIPTPVLPVPPARPNIPLPK